MISTTPQILFFLEMLVFASVIFMHLSKKSSTVVTLYMLQSLIIFVFLMGSALKDFSWLLMAIAIFTFVVKVVAAPYYFKKLIRKNHIKFSASTYLNGPLTLIILAMITAVTYSRFFQPLTAIALENAQSMLLAAAMMLGSIFLLINRKGALSQSIGVLSLENGIVSFAFMAGLEQAPGLELGIIFDIAVWIIISATFTSMIYKQRETLDVSTMSHLKEE
jgi:hydrogenase-4 component E